MTQDTRYPDPKQLRVFADEPMPFHDITPSDLGLKPDGRLEVSFENVKYVYRKSSVLVNPDGDRFEPIEQYTELSLEHGDVWRFGYHTEVTEDYVSVTGVSHDSNGDSVQYDVKWILDEIIINNPE